MIKKLIKEYQTITIYLSINLLMVAYFIFPILFAIFTSETLKCSARGFGSGAVEKCSVTGFFFENLFWAILPIIIIQIILIPSGIFSHFLSRYIQRKISFKHSEKLWYKYLLALSLYLIGAFLIFQIIGLIQAL